MFTLIVHYRNPSLAGKMLKTERKNPMNIILLHVLYILLYSQTPAMRRWKSIKILGGEQHY